MESLDEGSTVEALDTREIIPPKDGLVVELKGDGGSELSVGSFDRIRLEANAAATVEAAKKYANSLFSLAREATAKAAIAAEETANKLQSVVNEKTIIGNLGKEQEKFIEEVNANKLTTCTLPWSDLPDQWVAKKHILSFSLDARNFTRDPPSETNFDFAEMQSVAAALLANDPNLRKIRFQLVPKKLSEERFWRNYFYRVSLVRQAALGENRLPGMEVSVPSKITEQDESLESSALKDEKAEEEENDLRKTDDTLEIDMKEQNQNENDDSELKNKKLDKIRENITNATQGRTEEDLERDLVNCFSDYELVSDQMDKTDEQWEEEIAEILNSA
uniref:BSD domain-containing protein n=1 Tax=Setaria digitata TaxID=48799 RepID=A0A915PLL0_9BILA